MNLFRSRSNEPAGSEAEAQENARPVASAAADPASPNSPAALYPPEPGDDPPTDNFGAEPAEPDSAPNAVAPALRPLAAGTYLNGEIEIKELLLRGAINFYRAEAGDWGSAEPRLVGERAATGIPEPMTGPDAELYPPSQRFLQEDREYAVWAWQPMLALVNWHAAPHDEIYLHLLAEAARGLHAAEEAGVAPSLPADNLFLEASGHLRVLGFFDPGETDDTSPVTAGARELARFSTRLLKQNLARGATLRLDDEFGALPFSEEVKALARALAQGELASLAAALPAIEALIGVRNAEIGLLSDVGLERELNEDSGLSWKWSRAGHARNLEIDVLAVADGMGGHEGGEIASDLTLATLEQALVKRGGMDFADNAAVKCALKEILDEINEAVVRMNEDPPYSSMRNKPGSTLVVGLRIGSRVFLGNCGDSRAYRWNARDGLQRLTKDHSYVQDLIDSGRLKPEDAWDHPDGSVITSHIGMARGGQRDVFLRLLSPGDKLVLVSDGVVDTLRDSQIATIVAGAANCAELCAALVNAANDAGGIDNITVACLISS